MTNQPTQAEQDARHAYNANKATYTQAQDEIRKAHDAGQTANPATLVTYYRALKAGAEASRIIHAELDNQRQPADETSIGQDEDQGYYAIYNGTQRQLDRAHQIAGRLNDIDRRLIETVLEQIELI